VSWKVDDVVRVDSVVGEGPSLSVESRWDIHRDDSRITLVHGFGGSRYRFAERAGDARPEHRVDDDIGGRKRDSRRVTDRLRFVAQSEECIPVLTGDG